MNNAFLLGTIKHVEGDATLPVISDNRVIINIVNTNGETENTFFQTLAKRWLKAKDEYRGWFRSQKNFRLGESLIIQLQSDTSVAHLLAIKDNDVDYDALEKCLTKLGKDAEVSKFNVHIQKSDSIDWDKVESLLKKHLAARGVKVVVYK